MYKSFLSFLILFMLIITPAIAAEQNLFSACEVTGSTTLYDMEENRWYKSDKMRADQRTLPASTFKIMHSLIALDMQATTPDEVFKWDGQQREIPVWNQDTIFKDAFKNSTVWVYEELTQRIDNMAYKRYLYWSGYEGNDDIDHGNERGNFWVAGNWGISPIDQINMLVKLYNNDLPFSRASMETVKGFMQQDDDKSLFGKTGWTRKDGQHIGWWIGYKTYDNRAPIFFATRILKDTDQDIGNFSECRKTITEYYIQNNYAN
jgi:beta-lactamase class D